MASTVQYWEDIYMPKYSGGITDGYELPLVDQEILYNGLDGLVITAAGETTGVPTADFFKYLETPDYRTPFPDIVHQFVTRVNKVAVEIRDDNYNYSPHMVLGLGPSRPYYFLPQDVVRGSIRNGFHRNEKSLHATQKKYGNEPYIEYPGYNCANRKFRFFHAPTFSVPDWDGIGPKYHEVGVHLLGVDARLHSPRNIWPGYRTDQEDEDARLGRVRLNDCFMCRSFEILYNLGVKRFRKKAKMRESGVKFPNTFANSDHPMFTCNASTQTDPVRLFTFTIPGKENPRGVLTPSRGDVRKKRSGIFQRQRSESPTTPRHLRKTAEPTKQRSSSVGSPRESSTQNSGSRRTLFEGGNACRGEKEKTPRSPQEVIVHDISKTPDNPCPRHERPSKPRKVEKVDIFKGIHHEKKPDPKESQEDRARRQEKDRRSILAEIERQEKERQEEHESNKKNKEYHLCPKLNWDSSTSMALTDSSCNSTCECVHNEKILKAMDKKSQDSNANTSRDSSQVTPQSSFLHDSSATSMENERPLTRPQEVTKPPQDPSVNRCPHANPFYIETNKDDSEMILPSTTFEPKFYTQIKRKERSEAKPHYESEPRDVKDSNELGSDEDEEENEATETEKEEEEEEEEEEENEEEDSPASQYKSVTADSHRTPTPGKSATKKSPQQVAYEHLLEVNRSGGDLDVSKLPDNACVLTYSPNSGVNFRTLSMEPDDFDQEEEEQDESASMDPNATSEGASGRDESTSGGNGRGETPKKVTPKRPHSSPTKASNQRKKHQAEPSSEQTQSELFLTQVEDIPEYLTSREWKSSTQN